MVADVVGDEHRCDIDGAAGDALHPDFPVAHPFRVGCKEPVPSFEVSWREWRPWAEIAEVGAPIEVDSVVDTTDSQGAEELITG